MTRESVAHSTLVFQQAANQPPLILTSQGTLPSFVLKGKTIELATKLQRHGDLIDFISLCPNL